MIYYPTLSFGFSGYQGSMQKKLCLIARGLVDFAVRQIKLLNISDITCSFKYQFPY